MDLITINKSISYKTNSNIIEYKNSINDNKHTNENSNNTIFKGTDNSSISNDAVLGYKFLNRIETSIKDITKSPFIEKYSSEYENIKKEIVSGTYGSDTNKYTGLLDNVFKNALNLASNILLKGSTKSDNMKMSSSTLIKCQKQYETANGLVWIFREENKKILKEIEECKKKKNHQKVASLTQLSDTYKHVINNLSCTINFIQENVNNSFDTDSNESKNQDELTELQNEIK
ncbi:hypothetical protein HBE96_14030 [Clostridium sp. P21]|uniref:Uncharacterized protein n=1 Tax=Clostridium muellerianum TaxID=2716538 RepID=A0A7Y0EI25_9CLOT|nr:hypothetical protein [Clostridium muellerianum]NMM63771.1 hypothetical protein [Clostridium muellerianum]